MKIHVWGMDFRRGSSESRRQLYLPIETRRETLRQLLALGFQDLVYLTTCNRVEFYTTAPDYFSDTRSQWMKLLSTLGLSEEAYYHGYHFEGKAGLRHLMRVASSLESMVVGESQILGQLKDALAWTQQEAMPVSKNLVRTFHAAFNTAKIIRTETGIGSNPVSVASLGLEAMRESEAKQPFVSAVVVGRGPMSIKCLMWLKEDRPDVNLLWVNRSLSSLDAYPELVTINRMSLDNFLRNPPEFDLLVTATSSAEEIFSEKFFQGLAKIPRLVLDFAQPADVAPSLRGRTDMSLLNLEDLTRFAELNQQERTKSIQVAETYIDKALRAYCMEQKQGPLLKDFSGIELILERELESVLMEVGRDFPIEFHEKLQLRLSKVFSRNLHLSREHLRSVLAKVSDVEPTLSA